MKKQIQISKSFSEKISKFKKPVFITAMYLAFKYDEYMSLSHDEVVNDLCNNIDEKPSTIKSAIQTLIDNGIVVVTGDGRYVLNETYIII